MKQKTKRKKKRAIPTRYPPIGIAARDIKEGELIKYKPFLDTKDIIVNEKKPTSSEVEAAIKTLQILIKFEHAQGSTCITTALCERLKEAN